MSPSVTPPLDQQVPSAEELVSRAAALREQLWEDADEADRTRRVTERNIAAITDAGLLRLMMPRRLGGYETTARTLVDVTLELGRGCGSTAWVAGILNAGAWLTGIFPDEAQRDVWGEHPSNRVAGVLAPSAETRPVDGGMMITGRWGYASGSLHSEWVVAAGPVRGADGEPETHLVLLPADQITVEDTWFVAGMRGTGSNTVVAEEVFVPEHRMLSLPRAIAGEYRTEHTDEALYRASFAGILMLAIAGPQIGLAQAALEHVLEKAPNRAIASTIYTVQAESELFQATVAEAATRIDTARMHAYRAADDVDRAAAAGGPPTDARARARVRMDTAWVAQQCREAIDLLLTAHGTSAFAEVSPLQRIWRDQEVASRHAIVAPNVVKEAYGKALLGVEPNITALL
jgi:alkylation response protein AidB-like acyl-CoA dehydrogenase